MAVTFTPDERTATRGDVIRRQKIAWTSNSAGAASGTVNLSGFLLRVTFVPGSGSDQPTNGYDVTLTDAGGIDILSGLGANLSNTTANDTVPTVDTSDGTTTATTMRALADTCTLSVTNAGDTKSGTIYLYLK